MIKNVAHRDDQIAAAIPPDLVCAAQAYLESVRPGVRASPISPQLLAAMADAIKAADGSDMAGRSPSYICSFLLAVHARAQKD